MQIVQHRADINHISTVVVVENHNAARTENFLCQRVIMAHRRSFVTAVNEYRVALRQI